MRSTVHLYNIALARLGGEQLDELASPQERDALGSLCDNLFPHVLDLALSAFAWSFALRRTRLALVSGEGAGSGEGRLAYALPTDCVKPTRLEGYGGLHGGPAYSIEGTTLYTNTGGAVLVYVSRATDPKTWPPAFADALAWGLAAELASAKCNDANKQQWALQNYELALGRAVARDRAAARELPPVSAWRAARFGSMISDAKGGGR